MSTKRTLSSLSHVSDDTEFFTPMPTDYEPGKTKYVVVFGTVMSGLGKGIFSSSLAKILQDKGLTVAPIKLEGYFNRDSGTLNPYRHGEVFVLDDGMECDMDLGTYERMLNQDLTRLNFTTSGQIFSSVLDNERKGEYRAKIKARAVEPQAVERSRYPSTHHCLSGQSGGDQEGSRENCFVCERPDGAGVFHARLR